MRKDTQWQFAGDVSWSDYGGKWFRRTTPTGQLRDPSRR